MNDRALYCAGINDESGALPNNGFFVEIVRAKGSDRSVALNVFM